MYSFKEGYNFARPYLRQWRNGLHEIFIKDINFKWRVTAYYLHLMPCYFQCHVSMIILVGWNMPSHMNWADPKEDHLIRGKGCERGFVLMIVSSLCPIHSESLHGFCHFHLNCSSHWWWLLFHLHNFPEACPTIVSFFIDSCPMGTICINSKFTSVSNIRLIQIQMKINLPFYPDLQMLLIPSPNHWQPLACILAV